MTPFQPSHLESFHENAAPRQRSLEKRLCAPSKRPSTNRFSPTAWTKTYAVRLLALGLLTAVLAVLKGRAATVLSSDSPWTNQVPAWTADDAAFFLHGSMSTEIVPETLLRAFIRVYPDFFPSADLSHLGLIPDPGFGWPIGFSRARVPHLGDQMSVGINCAACHVGEVTSQRGTHSVRVLGMTSHFDAEGFFGALIGATFRSVNPTNMQHLLSAWLEEIVPNAGSRGQTMLSELWQRDRDAIDKLLRDDPFGAKDTPPGTLHPINAEALALNPEHLAHGLNLADTVHTLLRLFHNMRTALHVPDQVPDKAPPASGPGRNDAFGLLSLVLFGAPQPSAPVKYGLVWNLADRQWVHWDANTRSPLGRNLLASLGLGAPSIGHKGQLDFNLVKRQTDLSEGIRAPHYPFAIDEVSAHRGQVHFEKRCASCHGGQESDQRLYDVKLIGTDPNRAESFDPASAGRFNTLLAQLETPGYQPFSTPAIRSTQKYWAPTLAGVWARSPYLHNGSVRTLRDLLTAPKERPESFHRGTRSYDEKAMGYEDQGSYLLETTHSGNSQLGHEFGTDLSQPEKQDLIEYLKTL